MNTNVKEVVEHPAHYTNHPSGVECIAVAEHFGFCLGNVIKYVWRAGLKGEAVVDLRKAAFYLAREIERREAAAPPLANLKPSAAVPERVPCPCANIDGDLPEDVAAAIRNWRIESASDWAALWAYAREAWADGEDPGGESAWRVSEDASLPGDEMPLRVALVRPSDEWGDRRNGRVLRALCDNAYLGAYRLFCGSHQEVAAWEWIAEAAK